MMIVVYCVVAAMVCGTVIGTALSWRDKVISRDRISASEAADTARYLASQKSTYVDEYLRNIERKARISSFFKLYYDRLVKELQHGSNNSSGGR